MTNIEKLKDIIYNSGSNKHKFNVSKDPELFQWVMDYSSNLLDSSSFLERVYVCLNGYQQKCPNGKIGRFSENLNIGYAKFCGRETSCCCAKLQKSNTVKESWKTRNNDSIQEKKKATNIERYGVEHVMQSNEKIKEREQIFLTKFGETTNLKTTETKNQIKKTNLEKYGSEHAMQNSKIAAKSHNTFKENHQGLTNFERPSVKQTMIEKHGNIHYWSSKISPINLNIIKNQQLFEEYVSNKSILDISSSLGIDVSTIGNYIRKYNCNNLIDRSKSKGEQEISNFLNEQNISHINNDRSIIKPMELDIVIPEYNLAIEYCGLYWHSEIHRPDKNYHKRKMEAANNAGYQLLTIWESEWRDNSDILKRKILNLCRQLPKGIGARKLNIKEITVSESSSLLTQYHIQGPVKATVHIGAYFKDQLISVGLFHKNKDHYEMVRFCSDGRNHPGAFSKIVKYFQTNYKSNITTFADLRMSDGGLYKNNGWAIDNIQDPTYYYTDLKNVFHKFKFRKNNIKKIYPDINIEQNTEKQLMDELGYLRLWDCGKIKFIKTYIP